MNKKTKCFVHESSYVDDDVKIGINTKIWHFSHVQSGARIGRSCILGQNVNIGNNVEIAAKSGVRNSIGDNQKIMGDPAIKMFSHLKKILKNSKNN